MVQYILSTQLRHSACGALLAHLQDTAPSTQNAKNKALGGEYGVGALPGATGLMSVGFRGKQFG